MARRHVETSTAQKPRFVVERYAPELTLERVRAGEARARSAARAVSRAGRCVRYLGSIVIEVEQTVFSVFEADTTDVVADVNRRARLPFDRIVPVLDLRESERPAPAVGVLGDRRSSARLPRRSASAGGASLRKGSQQP